MWIYKSQETGRFTGEDDHQLPVDPDDDHHDSTTSSSIGDNSDASGGRCDSDDDAAEEEEEVQSLFKGSLNNLSDLENALALKKGISSFYSGKSKSYTSLADAVAAPSIQDIVKPEDAYNRKRKNMLAHSIILNKNRNFASSTSEKIANNHLTRPPLPARDSHSHRSILPTNDTQPPWAWRSLSLSDLQHAASGSLRNKRDDDD